MAKYISKSWDGEVRAGLSIHLYRPEKKGGRSQLVETATRGDLAVNVQNANDSLAAYKH